jgi:hypothetical protein
VNETVEVAILPALVSLSWLEKAPNQQALPSSVRLMERKPG